MINLDGSKWSMKARKVVKEVIKEAARYWLLQVSSKIPKDTGFLLGAFNPLAEMLNVKVVGAGALRRTINGKTSLQENPLIYLKKQTGAASVRQALIRARAERERRRRILSDIKEKNRQRILERQNLQDLEFSKQQDTALSKRERYIQRQIAFFQRRKMKKAYVKNKNKFQTLGRQIERLQEKLKKIRARQVDYKKMQANIYDRRSRQKFVTERTVVKPSQKEILDALRKKQPRPADKVIIKKRLIRAGDSEALVSKYNKRYYPGRGLRGPIKTPDSGRRYATDPGSIFTEPQGQPEFIKGAAFTELGQEGRNITLANLSGRGVSNPTKAVFEFKYDVDITYYRIMDATAKRTKTGKSYTGTPWLSQAYASRVFLSYLEQQLPKRLPYFVDYIVKTKSTLKNTSFTRGLK